MIWKLRYWLCRVALKLGLPPDVPLVGVRGDGCRDCGPMLQAGLDAGLSIPAICRTSGRYRVGRRTVRV